MLKFGKGKKKKYVNISLEQKAKDQVRVKWTIYFRTLRKREWFLIILSLLTFLGIFAEKYFGEQYVQQERDTLEFIKNKIKAYDKRIQTLKETLSKEDTKFRDFYIPSLKEKLLYLWFHKHLRPQIQTAVQQYSQIVGSAAPFIGSLSYPNPYIQPEKGIYTPQKIINLTNQHKVIFKPFEKNPFVENKYLFKSFTLAITLPSKKDSFIRNIAKIKDKTIRANLLLEYGLIKYGLKNINIKSPASVIFPVNVVLPAGEIYQKTLEELKNFCNILQINREYRKEFFFQNRLQVKAVLDAICIKYIF